MKVEWTSSTQTKNTQQQITDSTLNDSAYIYSATDTSRAITMIIQHIQYQVIPQLLLCFELAEMLFSFSSAIRLSLHFQ